MHRIPRKRRGLHSGITGAGSVILVVGCNVMSAGADKTIAQPSPWPFTIAAALLLVLTWYLLGLYSIVHWQLRPAKLLINTKVTELYGESLADTNKVPLSPERVRALEQAVEDLTVHSRTVMNRLEAYHLTGLAAFLCSIISVLRKPRWVGIMGLVFGIAGLGLAAVIM